MYHVLAKLNLKLTNGMLLKMLLIQSHNKYNTTVKTSGCFNKPRLICPSRNTWKISNKKSKMYIGSVGSDIPNPPKRLSLLTDRGAKDPKNKRAFSVYKMEAIIAAMPIGSKTTQKFWVTTANENPNASSIITNKRIYFCLNVNCNGKKFMIIFYGTVQHWLRK